MTDRPGHIIAVDGGGSTCRAAVTVPATFVTVAGDRAITTAGARNARWLDPLYTRQDP